MFLGILDQGEGASWKDRPWESKQEPNTETGGKVSFTEAKHRFRTRESVLPRRSGERHLEHREQHWEMDFWGFKTPQKHTLEELYTPDEHQKARVFVQTDRARKEANLGRIFSESQTALVSGHF